MGNCEMDCIEQIDALYTQLEGMEELVKDRDIDMHNLEYAVSELKREVQNREHDIDYANERLNELENTIFDLEDGKYNLEADIDALRSREDDLEDTILTLNEELEDTIRGAKDEVSYYSGRCDDLVQQVDELENELAYARSHAQDYL